jgi:two-component system, OmpR family, phosphate regulon sensor histidine kinase PhoR
VRHAMHLAFSLGALGLALTAAYYVSEFVYRRIGIHPPGLLALIGNATLAILLMIAVVNIIGVLFRPRRRDLFGPVTGALERIATGDFTARLDESSARGPFGDLVRTVNQTAARLDQLERMRQQFVSNVSHEIQSPLTSIRGFAAALRQDNLSEAERRHYLDIIEAESLRLSRLSANLLELASLESDQARVAAKTYRLDIQVRDLILACETQWAGKHLDLDADLADVEITADEDLLGQVWTNLLHNAIKFTPDGGSVRIRLHRREDRLELSIADSGIGISAEDQARIFERFYKADRSRQSSTGGNGLGLAIAKRIVDMHRGSISVRSETGAGAEFLVVLPAV